MKNETKNHSMYSKIETTYKQYSQYAKSKLFCERTNEINQEKNQIKKIIYTYVCMYVFITFSLIS